MKSINEAISEVTKKRIATQLRDKINGEDTWVAIKDITPEDKERSIPSSYKYRVVSISTYNNMRKGVRVGIDKETGKEIYQNLRNPHKIVEIGRGTTRAEAKLHLPGSTKDKHIKDIK